MMMRKVIFRKLIRQSYWLLMKVADTTDLVLLRGGEVIMTRKLGLHNQQERLSEICFIQMRTEQNHYSGCLYNHWLLFS